MPEEKSKDRALGMDRPITRRDFLNGIAIGTAAVASGPLFADPLAAAARSSPPVAAQDASGYYPPLLTGMRGSHPGSFEAAHALRDGRPCPPPVDTGEEYDLIVVGGGISGLAAAHFYRARTSPGSRILILDNHDDFGGHAKRNEFNLDGHLHLLNGGTLEIDSPRPYGPVAAGLLQTLGHRRRETHQDHAAPEILRPAGTAGGRLLRSRDLRRRQARGRHRHAAARPSAGAARRSRSERARKSCRSRPRASITCPGCHPTRRSSGCRASAIEAFLRDVVRVDPAVLKYYHAAHHGRMGRRDRCRVRARLLGHSTCRDFRA